MKSEVYVENREQLLSILWGMSMVEVEQSKVLVDKLELTLDNMVLELSGK